MKYAIYIIVYMLICGMAGGAVFNLHHERCGTRGYATDIDVIYLILLPVIVGFSITYNDEYYIISECKGEEK